MFFVVREGAFKVKIAVVVGTRPEFIKMAPVVRALRQKPQMECQFISSGQHREMLAQVAKTFQLRPDLDMKVMQENQNLSSLMSACLNSLGRVLRKLKPDVVLAQGDTTTVIATALASFYERIPFGHVEAGLRTDDYKAPWPEEMNRRLTDSISRWCFAPTESAAENLRREGILEEFIHVTGNTVIDALFWVREQIREAPPAMDDMLGAKLRGKRVVLVTAHRRESFGGGLERICRVLQRISNTHENVVLVYPVHLNPNVKEPVHRMLGDSDNIILSRPLNYSEFVWMLDNCHMVLTDSGGVQEEAPAMGKPVLVMRDKTERPEGISAGVVRLVGTDEKRIFEETMVLLTDPDVYAQRARVSYVYGDGHASKRITEVLLEQAL